MNKKIVSVLTALLIVTMAVPVFADNHMEDKVKVTGEVKSVFQVGSYSDNVDAAADLWADGEVLDGPDMDEYPAKKAFYQEISFNVAAMVNNNINFDLAVDTLTNNFAKTATENGYGAIGSDETDLAMDTATLTVSDSVSTLKIGDVGGFHADYTFIDDEDREGMTLDTVAMNSDVTAFVLGDNGNGAADFYGVTATRDMEAMALTAKVLHANDYNNMNVTNLVGAVETDLTNAVSANAKLVMNNWKNNNTDNDDGDTFMSAGVTAEMNDALTLNGKMEMAGEKFKGVADGTEGANTSLYEASADYAMNDANTVTGTYTLVADDDEPEDKSTVEVAVENVVGAYTNTASIAMTSNDDFAKKSDVTLIKVGTEYAMDAATLSANLTNKSADAGNDLTYITAGLDQDISENVNWNTTFDYVTGTNTSDVDADGMSLETALTVSF